MSKMNTSRKIKILPAKRKHRLEMKKVNEECLPENYDESIWSNILARHESFVLISSGEVVGYCLAEEGVVLSLAVKPEYRGKGYGEELLEAVINDSRDVYEKITLQVRKSNNVARNLYSKIGFKVSQVLDRYYDDGEDALEMYLQI